MTACVSEGAASELRAARASAADSTAYGSARASAAYPTCWRRATSPERTTQRPACHSSAPGISSRPSGSMPICPAPCSAKATWWAASQSVIAVRSTPGRPLPKPACGAVIHPIAVSVVSSATPVPATALAAMAPVTASGRR